MEPLKEEFDQLLKLSKSLILTRSSFNLDLYDPIVINTISAVNDPFTTLIEEDKYLKINGIELHLVLKEYLSQIDNFLVEFDENVIMPIDSSIKIDYCNLIQDVISKIEVEIVMINTIYISKDLQLTDITLDDLDEGEKMELSQHFGERKKKLRQLIKYIVHKNQQITDNFNVETSQFISTNKKIQLNDDINLIVTLFYDLLEKRYILTTKTNLTRFILNNFLDKDRQLLKKNTIETILKTNKEEKRKNTAEKIIIPDK
jgi:hypothetical protein